MWLAVAAPAVCYMWCIHILCICVSRNLAFVGEPNVVMYPRYVYVCVWDIYMYYIRVCVCIHLWYMCVWRNLAFVGQTNVVTYARYVYVCACDVCMYHIHVCVCTWCIHVLYMCMCVCVMYTCMICVCIMKPCVRRTTGCCPVAGLREQPLPPQQLTCCWHA